VTIALGRGLSGLRPTPARSRSAESPWSGSVHPPVPRWALVTTGLLPVLLTAAWSIAGALQPTSYSPVRQSVSVLAGYGGTHRWIVTSALYGVGFGYLATAVGLRAVGALARLGLVLSGATAIAVASLPQPEHGSSTPHVVTTGIGALALATWPVIVARPGTPVRMALGGRFASTAAGVSIGLLVWMAIETRDGTALGLAERMSSSLQTCWPFVVALALYRNREISLE
jgi:hypothetical protein